MKSVIPFLRYIMSPSSHVYSTEDASIIQYIDRASTHNYVIQLSSPNIPTEHCSFISTYPYRGNVMQLWKRLHSYFGMSNFVHAARFLLFCFACFSEIGSFFTFSVNGYGNSICRKTFF
mmetsp:Transcript_25447/g.54015  ORF Transcript_25447/g.54015 Transcript_25447/m.54015 type:complete len:119 (-) Transcript_25447:5-361(-)